VPGRAAELAVGRALEPDVLLHADDLADAFVLDPSQLVSADPTCFEVVARLEESLWAQQAADVIGAERGG
jgi:hypothetical protein